MNKLVLLLVLFLFSKQSSETNQINPRIAIARVFIVKNGLSDSDSEESPSDEFSLKNFIASVKEKAVTSVLERNTKHLWRSYEIRDELEIAEEGVSNSVKEIGEFLSSGSLDKEEFSALETVAKKALETLENVIKKYGDVEEDFFNDSLEIVNQKEFFSLLFYGRDEVVVSKEFFNNSFSLFEKRFSGYQKQVDEFVSTFQERVSEKQSRAE